MRGSGALRLVCLSLLLAVPAFGATQQDLKDAIKRVDSLEFDKAIEILKRVVDASPPKPTLAKARLYLGLCYFNLGRADEGRVQFTAALAIDPLLKLPAATAPKIVEAFDPIRAEANKNRKLEASTETKPVRTKKHEVKPAEPATKPTPTEASTPGPQGSSPAPTAAGATPEAPPEFVAAPAPTPLALEAAPVSSPPATVSSNAPPPAVSVSPEALAPTPSPSATAEKKSQPSRWGPRFWTPAGVGMACGTFAVLGFAAASANQKSSSTAGFWAIVGVAHVVGFGVSATWAIVNVVRTPAVTVTATPTPTGVSLSGSF